ncbi:tyrosine-type recombinase/integrase [Thalassotalea litorea]|uniref:tyrosine-type recombinase/integrase n=1 Tax=Thalassotalea litorea TaxID=2020715 RepID=UPI003734E1B8
MNHFTQDKPFIPWNKAQIVGQRKPLKISHIWGIRVRLELTNNHRDLALFNMALDSKLRACDLVSLKVSDISHGRRILSRATITQKKTGSPVQFEITKATRESVIALIAIAGLDANDYLFKSRLKDSEHLSTRQYSRIFHGWISALHLDHSLYGTHSLRRTKPYLIYKKTKNLRVVQLLLGHKKLESTVRYLGIEVDDALEISESIEV